MNDLELVGQGVLSLEEHKAEKSQLANYVTNAQVDTKLEPYAKKTDIPEGQDLSGYAKLTDVQLETATRTAITALLN